MFDPKRRGSYYQVDPNYELSDARLDEWFPEKGADTIIVTGFVARTPDGIPTTLKRDGSDFSAAIMGALFRAGRITIWTDVDGVYSADPRKVRSWGTRKSACRTIIPQATRC